MPKVSEQRAVAMPAGELWQLVSDPRHLSRWWPRVERVEGVDGAFFTQMLRSSSGKLVRADFEVVERDDREMRIVWAQRIAGSPFAHVLSASTIEVSVRPAADLKVDAPAEVVLTLVHTPKRWFSRSPALQHEGAATELWTAAMGRLGSPMIRRAAAKTVKEALDGLQHVCG